MPQPPISTRRGRCVQDSVAQQQESRFRPACRCSTSASCSRRADARAFRVAVDAEEVSDGHMQPVSSRHSRTAACRKVSRGLTPPPRAAPARRSLARPPAGRAECALRSRAPRRRLRRAHSDARGTTTPCRLPSGTASTAGPVALVRVWLALPTTRIGLRRPDLTAGLPAAVIMLTTRRGGPCADATGPAPPHGSDCE